MDGSEGLLAILIPASDAETDALSGATFLTPTTCPLQVGTLRHRHGATVHAHRHPPVPRTIRGTPEVLVMRGGVVRLDLYASDGTFVSTHVLRKGDVAVLLSGGHGLEVVVDCNILEVKQGPYLGTDDKVYLKV